MYTDTFRLQNRFPVFDERAGAASAHPELLKETSAVITLGNTQEVTLKCICTMYLLAEQEGPKA
jgi:hypothetical protein